MASSDTQAGESKVYDLPDFELTPSILEEFRLKEQQELNRNLDEVIQRHPNRLPRSVYFIVANEFGERFCYNGIKPLVYMFLTRHLLVGQRDAKTHFHIWLSLTNLFPIVGAAFSDSYYGKYNTIVAMSIIYLFGTYALSVFSIPDLLWKSTEGNFQWPALLSLYLVGVGAGGIKPCVTSHGGDQFPPSHYHLLNKFFQIFFWAINIASLLAGVITPLIKDKVECFGKMCYFASFGLCGVVSTCALVIFVFGSRHYRIVPPPGEFLPWKALRGAWKARNLWRNATEEKRGFHGHWLNFADDFVGAHFTEEIRLLGKVMVMFTPFIFFFYLFDQFTPDWQAQVESLNTNLFGNIRISVEMASYVNTLLVIIFLPILNYVIYPFIQKRGWRFRLLDRMAVGYFFVILSFIAYNILQRYISLNVLGVQVEHDFIVDDDQGQTCSECLSWFWQLPQIFLLSFGEAIISPSGLEFAYSQVGPQMKASSASIWLLTSAIGNLMISLSQLILEEFSNFLPWFYVCVSSGGFIMLLLLKYFFFVYKEDELEIYDDDEDTFSLSHIENES